MDNFQTETGEAEGKGYPIILNELTEYMILDALRTEGDPIEAYHYMFENLKVDEAEDIKAFMEWVKETDRPIGRVNIGERWQEFIGMLTYQELPAFYLATHPNVHLTDKRK